MLLAAGGCQWLAAWMALASWLATTDAVAPAKCRCIGGNALPRPTAAFLLRQCGSTKGAAGCRRRDLHR